MSDTAKKIEELEKTLAELKKENASVVAIPAAPTPLRLDFGCGKNKKEGFKGVDIRKFDGVDFCFNIAEDRWPWEDNSVDEAHASHFIEHLTWPQRVHFFNELGRVLKKHVPQTDTGKATLIWPHPFSERYWGDPTHQAALSGFALYYLNKEWRKVNAPHNDFESNEPGPHFWHEYTCDFDFTPPGHSLHPALNGRNQEYIQHAMQFYTEARQDVVATIFKK